MPLHKSSVINSSQTQQSGPGPTILIVDDSETELLTLEAALRSLKEPILCATSAQVSANLLNGLDLAVMIVDVNVLLRRNTQVAALVRNRAKTTPTILLGVEAQKDAPEAQNFEHSGDFVLKPVESTVLLGRVQPFILLHHHSRQLSRVTASYEQERLRSAQRLRTLTGLSAILTRTMTTQQVMDAFVSEAHGAVGAANSFVYMLPSNSADQLRLTGVGGVAPDVLPQFETVSMAHDLPVTVAFRNSVSIWVADRAALVSQFPSLDGAGDAQAVVALPLVVDKAAMGVVVFSFSEPHSWEVEEREFYATLVSQLATALERARLFETERQARLELEARTEGMRLLADVGTLLSSSLDYERALKQLTEVVVPAIADWCAIDVLDNNGRIQRLAAFHEDPSKIALARELEERYPNDPNAPHGVPNVLRTGQLEWMADIPDALLHAAAKNDEHLRLIQSLGLRSYVAVPLKARGRILGVLSLVYAESGRNYNTADVTYIDELARRASMAIDNAKLFTQQLNTLDKLERQSQQSLLVGDVGTALTRGGTLQEALQLCAEAIVHRLDAAFARIWTLDRGGDVLELQASAGMYTHLDGDHGRVPVGQFKIGRIAQQGEPHLTNAVQEDPWVSDPEWARKEGMIAFAGYPLMVEGKVMGVMALFARHELSNDTLAGLASIADAVVIGIDRARADEQARVERDTLEVVNEVGRALASELEQGKLTQAVTDFATRLSGAAFGAFFYNAVGPTGDILTLYAISGVSRDSFSKFPMPRNTQVFAATFEQQLIVRVDDIRKDPRYGHNAPYFGMPEGHLPVASYLAVPVISRSGTAIGALFFGHPRPGMFTQRHESLVAGVAAQAAVAMDNARLFSQAQMLIAQLAKSNKDLDQFAYVASHDLKAPLRGISNLSQWLEEDLGENIPATIKEHLNLLRNRTRRMEGLINGILDYSRAGRVRTKPELVSVAKLLTDITEMIALPEGCCVELSPDLPELHTEKVPLQQVFMNLLGNSIKHAKRSDTHVTVSAKDDGSDYVEFAVSDNGSGIAPEFHERIWGIFQTLEPRDTVEGTGIGLSVVKKIVENKGGCVAIKSSVGAGATFTFTWPKAEKATVDA